MPNYTVLVLEASVLPVIDCYYACICVYYVLPVLLPCGVTKSKVTAAAGNITGSCYIRE